MGLIPLLLPSAPPFHLLPPQICRGDLEGSVGITAAGCAAVCGIRKISH
jgi:hypothetical protein